VFFYPKSDFRKKILANIFAMSAAESPWGGGFESHFLAKSEILSVYLENSVFGHTAETQRCQGANFSVGVKIRLKKPRSPIFKINAAASPGKDFYFNNFAQK
jgi:hypothetical protein